jgi:hypothetical protein
VTEALVGPLFGVHTITADVSGPETRALMLIYSGGVLLIFAAFALMHQHAWRLRTALGLNPVEALNLRYSLRAHLISGGLAVVSIILILLSIVLPPALVLGGWVYALMGPLHAWNGTMQGRAEAALAKASAPAEQLQRQHERHDKPHQ